MKIVGADSITARCNKQNIYRGRVSVPNRISDFRQQLFTKKTPLFLTDKTVENRGCLFIVKHIAAQDGKPASTTLIRSVQHLCIKRADKESASTKFRCFAINMRNKNNSEFRIPNSEFNYRCLFRQNR